MLKLKPSSAGRWTKCPGSPLLESRQPRTTSTAAAADGIEAAKLAEQWLKTGAKPEFFDKGMDAAVSVYVEDVQQYLPGASHAYPEFRVTGFLYMTGYVDMMVMRGTELHIWDLKHGRVPVYAEGNLQLLCYAAALRSLGARTYHLHIVQPRSFKPPKEVWTITLQELTQWADYLTACAEAARAPEPQTVSGPQCKWCAALAHCHSAKMAAYHAIDYTATAVDYEMSPQETAAELEVLAAASRAIEQRLKAVDSHAAGRINKGEGIPGWKVANSRGSTVWSAPVQDVVAIAEAFGVEVSKPQGLITPKQAITAGIPEHVISQYSEHKPGEPTLQRDTTYERIFNNG